MTPGAALLIFMAAREYRGLMTRVGVQVLIIYDVDEL